MSHFRCGLFGKKDWLWSQIEVWTPHLTEPDSLQQAERGRVVVHLKVRPLTLMKLFFIRSFYVTETPHPIIRVVSSGLWRRVPGLTLFTLDQTVIQMDIKEEKWKMMSSWKQLSRHHTQQGFLRARLKTCLSFKSLFIQGGFTEHTWPFLETLCFTLIQPFIIPTWEYMKTNCLWINPLEVVGVKFLLIHKE